MTKRKSEIYHPYNLSFTLIFDEFPKELSESLNMPGKFHKKTSRIAVHDKTELEMDAPYIAEPDDDKLKEMTFCDIEHLNEPPNPRHINKFEKYIRYKMGKTGYPGFMAVASRYKPLKTALKYEVNPTYHIIPYYIDLYERDNWERLYRVRNKCRHNKVMSVETGIDLCNAILFPPENCSQERTREGLHYFLKSEIKNPRLEQVLYTVFYCMIDAYFDNEEEYRRLIKMLDEKVDQTIINKSETMIRLQNKLNKANKENQKLQEQNEELQEQNKEIKEHENALKKIKSILKNSNELNINQINLILSIISNIKE